MKTILPLAAFAGLALTVGSADAATVWNVNVGTEIDSTDNFVGAAAENTVSSTWNSIASADVTGMALKDSTDAATVVTLDFNTFRASGGTYGTFPDAGQLEIFDTYAGAGGVTVDFTLKGLDNSATYDLIIYSAWKWGGGNYPVTQTTGSGLSGTYTINSDVGAASLVEDTDPGSGANHGNWVRITGLTADGGELAFTGANGANAAFSGFQLINTVPEPSTTALLGLGGLALILRRRK